MVGENKPTKNEPKAIDMLKKNNQKKDREHLRIWNQINQQKN